MIIYAFTQLRICVLEVFRKSGFQNVLVRLIGFGGVHSQAAVGFTINSQRQALFTLALGEGVDVL